MADGLDHSMELSQIETDTLVALMDRIIPSDDFPSASDAGVVNYIRRILDTDLASSEDWYRSGLRLLNSEAEVRYKGAFAELSSTQQDELITLLEKRDTTCAWSVPPAEFIRVSVNLVSEGYYADPGNTGL
jgi:hypothetical protein